MTLPEELSAQSTKLLFASDVVHRVDVKRRMQDAAALLQRAAEEITELRATVERLKKANWHQVNGGA